MKTLTFLVLLVAGLTNLASCQNVESKKYAFSMQDPKGWHSIDKKGLNSNLKKFEFTEAEIEQLLKEQNANILIAAYYKYDPKITPGIIPTIQINARPNRTRDFEAFKLAIIRSIDSFKKSLDEFNLIEEPREVIVGGVRAILVHGTFVMKTPDGRKFSVRSRTYSVPQSGNFVQMNFTDNPDKEDCTAEFDELIKTIEFAK